MLGLSVVQGLAEVSVCDNGSGIEPHLLRHVFELFTQGQRTPDRAQGGLGLRLGLALVKSIVELHGGRVRAHSAGLWQGSTFTVSLPTIASPVASLMPPAPGPVQTAPASSLAVMVVDDNLDAAQMLGIWLQEEGYAVTVKTTPQEALEVPSSAEVDVYLLDIGLPQMDGYELVRRLRAQPRNQQATFIAVTGYGQARDIAQSKQAGFDYHFVKPLEPARLLAVLDQIRATA